MSRRYYVAITLYCGLIFWLSNQSNPPTPDISFPGQDKVAHIVLFGGLSGLISLGLHRAARPVSPWVLRFAPVLFVFAYGALDEIHQFFTPERTPDLLDLLADVTGAVLAHGLLSAYFRRQSRSASPGFDET